MSKWRFQCTATSQDFYLDFNPSRDTGWSDDPVFSEQHNIGATSTVLQVGGNKSRMRIAEGITKSIAIKAALQTLIAAYEVFTLTDHRGAARNAFLIELTWDELNDASNPIPEGTFRYKMKMIRRSGTSN